MALGIRTPIPSAAPLALLARREGARRAAERKGRCIGKPGKPARRANRDRIGYAITLPDQRIIADRRCCVRHSCHD